MSALNDRSSIFVWSLVLIGFVLVGYLVVVWVRRLLRPADEPPQPGFTLADLRELQRTGQITAEEYERARARMIAGVRHDAQRKQK